MTTVTYLVGEPVFQPWVRDGFTAPAGQAGLCVEVLRESSDREQIVSNFRQEYEAILAALRAMGVPFHIAYAHRDLVDGPTLTRCAELGCKFARFGEEFFPPAVAFPRDFSTVLPNLVLVHEHAAPKMAEVDGWKLLSSPFGEGGRTLFRGSRMIVCERLCYVDKSESRPVVAEDLDPIRACGVTVETSFAPIVRRITSAGPTETLALNDHIDRVAALIADGNDDLHLILDPGILTGRLRNEKGSSSWQAVGAQETAAALRKKLAPLGITVHLAPSLRNPYALNLLQVQDRTILMTGGEPELERFLDGLVGEGRVVTTDVPIRYIPTWLYAGIRCLVSEAPSPLLGRIC